MGQHRSPWNYIASNRREPCPYGGGTREDAEKRITPLMRRTQAHIVKQAVRTGAQLTESEIGLLTKRNMLQETLEMIEKAREN